MGGKARAEKLTKEERSAIARKAASARWIPKATHDGDLTLIEGASIPCAVLEDGTRVLSERGVTKALGGKRGGSHWRRLKEGGAELPVYISAPNFKPFISKELESALTTRIDYKTKMGAVAHGIPATLLPEVCEVFLKARDAGQLHRSQIRLAQMADILMRGLARIGIVALVDEATGYQEIRNKEALQALLDAFLRKEFAAWAKRFPDEFYKEIFRLRGWEWNRLSVKRPIFVGKLTNNIVYERLAPGVLSELEGRNPKDEKGRRLQKHHQWLSEDIGHPALAQHLHAVIGFMRASLDWKQFQSLLDKAFPKRGAVVQMELISD